jgi:hypothetical protein
MKKLFIKILIYSVLILLLLESLVRIFHLTKDYPDRYVDQYGVEKWVPNQSGYSVTGIRRQNVSEYHINNFGYNSYREFKPTKDKIEIALVGDSFIEGFHQNYNNSIGKKIEKRLPSVEVYEYGYAGYDLADQLHLINKYKETFDLIDYVVLGLKFENDLTRYKYGVLEDRMKLESPLYRSLRQIKLLVYLQHIGAFDSARELTRQILSIGKNNNSLKNEDNNDFQNKRNLEYIENFKKLVKTYGFNKTRFMFLLDKENTPEIFIDYLNTNKYAYIDYSEAFKKAKRSTTLIYDMHWNNYGRTIISNLIINYIQKLKNNPL